MFCPKCQHEQPDTQKDCGKCGVIFEKYSARLNFFVNVSPVVESRWLAFLKEFLLHVKHDDNPFYFAGRVVALLVAVFYGLHLVFSSIEVNAAGLSFLHLINLPFHEAGHLIFSPFGRLIASFGGSLMQLLVPLVCLVAFLFQTRDTFAASLMLWWFGENLIDLAPYINDAQSLKMMLLGGFTGRESEYGYHDWEFILNELGWLHHDHALAVSAHSLGALLMFCAVSWGSFLLFKQFKAKIGTESGPSESS